MQYFDLARQGQRAMAKRWQSCTEGFGAPGGTCFAQALKPSLNAAFRPVKARAKGERCTGGFRVLVKHAWRRCGKRLNAIFDLAKRWQSSKAARRVLGPWWNVLREGFETLQMQYFDLARQGQRAMAKALAKG